eukprot:449058-Pelagomonas_calceolata.AAC.5
MHVSLRACGGGLDVGVRNPAAPCWPTPVRPSGDEQAPEAGHAADVRYPEGAAQPEAWEPSSSEPCDARPCGPDLLAAGYAHHALRVEGA